MVVVLKRNPSEEQLNNLVGWIESQGVSVQQTKGEHTIILGLIGDTSAIDINQVQSMPIVETVKRIQEPYKSANRKFHPSNTVVDVCGHKIGDGNFQVIAGPCSVETEQQICEVAKRVKESGANLLRGGAFKPRTSPYSFQGLKAEGIELLLEAKKAYGYANCQRDNEHSTYRAF